MSILMSKHFWLGILVGIVFVVVLGWYAMDRLFGYASKISRPEKVYELLEQVTLYQDGNEIGDLAAGTKIYYTGEVDKILRFNLSIGFERDGSPTDPFSEVTKKRYAYVEMITKHSQEKGEK